MLGLSEVVPPETNSSTLRIGDRVGPYRLLREIGRGAMAVVFEASARGGRNVALKVLLPEIADHAQIVERFEREGRILQALRHENIARVFDVGTLPNGTLYLVIELLQGEDLRTTLAASGPLSIATAVRYLLGASRGAAEAHAQGIVHRDLKPANLFLAEDHRGGRVVKILDFGIAKVLSGVESQTNARDVICSPHYAPPEQLISSKAVRPQSDVWALGVVLYTALTDTLPFSGTSLALLLAAIQDHTPQPIRAVRPDCPRGLEDIVRRCLSKDPEARFATARELAEALEPFARKVACSSVPDVPNVSDDGEPSGEDKTLLFEEGTRLMPAARELQKRSAIASLAGPRKSLGASPGRVNQTTTRAPEGRSEAGRPSPLRPTAASSDAPRRRGTVTLLAAVVLLIGGVGVYVGTHGRWHGRSAQTVRLRITTQPEGASFSVDHGPQMTAPGEVSLSKAPRSHVLMVWKDGYRPESREVTIVDDTTLDVPLVSAPP